MWLTLLLTRLFWLDKNELSKGLTDGKDFCPDLSQTLNNDQCELLYEVTLILKTPIPHPTRSKARWGDFTLKSSDDSRMDLCVLLAWWISNNNSYLAGCATALWLESPGSSFPTMGHACELELKVVQYRIAEKEEGVHRKQLGSTCSPNCLHHQWGLFKMWHLFNLNKILWLAPFMYLLLLTLEYDNFPTCSLSLTLEHSTFSMCLFPLAFKCGYSAGLVKCYMAQKDRWILCWENFKLILWLILKFEKSMTRLSSIR